MIARRGCGGIRPRPGCRSGPSPKSGVVDEDVQLVVRVGHVERVARVAESTAAKEIIAGLLLRVDRRQIGELDDLRALRDREAVDHRVSKASAAVVRRIVASGPRRCLEKRPRSSLAERREEALHQGRLACRASRSCATCCSDHGLPRRRGSCSPWVTAAERCRCLRHSGSGRLRSLLLGGGSPTVPAHPVPEEPRAEGRSSASLLLQPSESVMATQ